MSYYTDTKERYQKVIKTCSKCGSTKTAPMYVNECTNCGSPGLLFFRDIRHIVRFIDVNGVKNLRITDQKLLNQIVEIFNGN